MNTQKKLCTAIILSVVLLCGSKTRALINPSLQPMDLAKRYEAVIGTVVSERDEDNGTMTLEVTDVFCGVFNAKEIKVTTVDATRDEPIFLDDGQPIAAFVVDKRRGTKVLFYTGGGVWQQAVIEAGDHSRWVWTEVLDSQEVNSLFGCFNGDGARLVEMMADLRDGSYYFPSRPFVQFSQQTLGTFDSPLRGVALYDVDADGDLDVYACSSSGNRLYLQTGSLQFTDATKKLGLADLAGISCAFADVNADGHIDLLADGVIYMQHADGRFSPAAWLPGGANSNVKSSAFADLNADGYPDVVVSKLAGGLHGYINPGRGSQTFKEVSRDIGLTKENCAPAGTGFFAPGDWNDDGRIDLYYGAASGRLLIQDNDGTFAPLGGGQLGFDLRTTEREPGMTGAGTMAALWQADKPSLLVPMDASYAFIARSKGRLSNVITATNELENEPAEAQISVLCEDLDADGNVDIFTGAREGPCNFHTNRGYGSFMRSGKYKPDAFPRSFSSPAWGLSAGDVNGDGANDLLLGGVNGTLTLLVNESLSLREKPTQATLYHQRKRYNTNIIAVTVHGPLGVTGSRLFLKNAKDKVLARCEIGTQVNTGSCSPNTANFAVRESGDYVLTVIWSDGATRQKPVHLDKKRLIRLNVVRPTKETSRLIEQRSYSRSGEGNAIMID